MISGKITTPSGQVMTYKVVKPRKRREKYNHPKKQSLAAGLLDEIERRGPAGMRVVDMAKWLWERSHPGIPFDPKKGRTRWSLHFYGDGGKHAGLLPFFCVKVGKRWARNLTRPHGGRPWHAMNEAGQGPQTYGRSKAGGWQTSYNSSMGQTMLMTYTPGPLP